jgi:hypothetical protein
MEKISKSTSTMINNSYSPENIIKNDKLSRFFINNVNKKELKKIYKRPMSKELLYNKQKNELYIRNNKLFSKKRNRNDILPSNLSIFRVKNIIPPPIKISDISQKYENFNNNINQLKKNDSILHYTQIKPIKLTKTKLDQYQKASKFIRKVDVNRNNIHLFSRKNNRKDIEMEIYKNYTFNKNSSFNEKNNSFDKEKKSFSYEKNSLSYKDKTTFSYKDKNSNILLDEKNKFKTFELNLSTKLPLSKISLQNKKDSNKPFFIIKDLSKVFHNKTLRLAMKKPILKIKLKE